MWFGDPGSLRILHFLRDQICEHFVSSEMPEPHVVPMFRAPERFLVVSPHRRGPFPFDRLFNFLQFSSVLASC